MNFILTTLTILTISMASPINSTIEERMDIIKPVTSEKTEIIKFKKVPTKWVKITKNSN